MPRKYHSHAFKTKRLALSAVLCALSVVTMGLGVVLEIMDITATMLASLLLLPIMLCYGNGYAVIAYAVTAVLSILLMPQSFSPWMYAGLLGYYPMIKSRLDRLPRFLSLLLKLILLLLALAVYFIMFYLLMMKGSGSLSEAFYLAFGEEGKGAIVGWITLLLAGIAFFAYDLLIDRLLVLYRYKWQSRVEKWMK